MADVVPNTGGPEVEMARGKVTVVVDRSAFDQLTLDVQNFQQDIDARVGGGLAGSNQGDRPIHEIRESLLDLRTQVPELVQAIKALTAAIEARPL